MITVGHQISDVRREVGTRVLEAGQARTVTVKQTYDTTIEDLWDACTSPERIPRWFLPITGELRPGGRYQLEGNAAGTIEQCDPPNSFFATWEYGGEITWIEVRLRAESERATRLEIEHIAHVDNERWLEFGPGAVGIGWDMGLLGLANHLASGEPVDRAESAGWLGSEQGREFISHSSDRWAEASVAAGTDPSQAADAAKRCTSAYTGG